jgi:hypothetical protein
MGKTSAEDVMRYGVVLLIGAGIGLLGAVGQAAEGLSLDGTRLNGEVKLGPDGRLRLVSDQRTVRLEDLARVRFAGSPPVSVRAALLHRITLANDQHLTGELLGLDARVLRLRSGWGKELTIPRGAIVAVGHPPGWITTVAEEFEQEPKAWKLSGGAALRDGHATSGKRSLCLSAAGQSAEYIPPASLEAGKVGIFFHDPGESAGARWLVETEFDDPKKQQTVRILVAGDASSYRADIPGTTASDHVPRKPGWHSLAVEFRPGSLIVSIDDLVLWPPAKADALKRPVGPLRRFRLTCAGVPGGGAVRGAVCFDDFSLAVPVSALRQRLQDAGQDEIVLRSGDQLFGHVPRADRHTLDIQGRFGARTLPWGEVRDIYLRRDPSPPQTTEGEHVRLWLRSGVGDGLDEIEGVVRIFDHRRLSVHHPVLGDLEIDPAQLAQLHWLFQGRRIEVDNGFHHLGRKLVPLLPAPRPEGLQLRRTFQLGEPVPSEARLVVGVLQLKGPGDGPDVARSLERGGLRTEVVLNGRVVDYLNRHGERSSSEPRRLSMPLPRQLLHTGENELILRQTEDRQTGRYEDCGIVSLAVEIPR